MGISLQPLVNINPQVVGGGQQMPQPDIAGQFLQAFLGAQQNKRASESLQLQKDQMERAERERQLNLTNARAEGEALRRVVLGFAKDETTRVDDTVRAAVQMGTQNPTAQMPSVGLQPTSGPMGQLASSIQGAPASVVPSVTAKSLPLMQMAEKKGQEAKRLAAIEQAIATVAPDKRQGARAVLTYAEMGANLPAAMQQQLWPELFPEGQMVDPQQLNAATALFKTGQFTWGQARRQAGVGQIAGVPDEVKYSPPSLKYERRPTEQQNKAAAQLTVMQSAGPLIDAYSVDRAPGFISSYLLNAKPGGIQEILANPLITEEDRRFISASRQFVDAWVRAVSGAQTNEQEFARILRSTIETRGDDPTTRQQKRNMRAQMTLAVSDVASGTMTRQQVIDRMLKLDWSKDQKKILMDYKAKAMKADKDTTVQMDTQGPIQSSDEMAERMARLEAMLFAREP